MASPSDVASGIPFDAVCSLCEKICKVSGTDKKKELVKTFFSKWRELHQTLHGNKKVVSIIITLKYHYCYRI